METSEECRAEVQKVSPKPGDLLLITVPPMATHAVMGAAVSMVKAAIEEMGIERVRVVALWENMKLTAASDDVLAAYGLQRLDRSVAPPAPAPLFSPVF